MNKILAVDDSVVQLTFVRKFAMELLPEYEVITAKSGEEAMEMVKNGASEICLAIIDYNMGGMTGLDLLKEIKNDIAPQKICICTANAQKLIEEQVLEAGANYIPKPFTKQKFEAMINRIIHGK